jgi:arylsulfatase A-like enzyme
MEFAPMLRKLLAVSLPALLASVAAPAPASPRPSAAPPKPNIVLIVSDDQGWADLGANGADADVRTPNLDRLAREGVRFAAGYVAAPQCTPSRAGLLTGRYPQRFGVERNGDGPLPGAQRTLAERLAEAGYATGQVGKWHLESGRGGGLSAGERGLEATGPRNPFLPHGQGFAEYFCGASDRYVASHDARGRPLPHAPVAVDDPRFRVDVQTEAALAFLERHAREPFFLYLAYLAPHLPLASPEPYYSQTPARLPEKRRQALALIAAMDAGVGRLRSRLRGLGLERNTLVVFVSDNGAAVGRGASGSLNRPWVGGKGMLTEGGIRSPFLAAWTGAIPAGQVFLPAVSSLDVAATAVALAGLPHDPQLDGVDLIPFLRGERAGDPHDALFWRWETQAAVRAGRWKLIRVGPAARFLFDLASGAGETRNRIDEQPALAARLEAQLAAWSATLPAPPPASELSKGILRRYLKQMQEAGAAGDGPRPQR